MPDALGLGVQTGLGLVQTAVGLINSGKAKREAAKLARTRPEYEISPLAGQELSLAESELASGGLSSRAESAYNNLNNQQFASSLDAILRGGGSVNSVADVFGENEEGRLRLAQLQDQTRMSKINNLVQSRRYMTEQGDKKFQINEYAPWMDKVTANGQARQQADQMIWSGLGTAGAGAINYSTQQNQENRYNSFLSSMNGQQGRQQQSNNGYQMPQYQYGNYSPGGTYGPPTGVDYGFKIDY